MLSIEDRASLARDEMGLSVRINSSELEFETNSVIDKLGLSKIDRKVLISGIGVYKSVRWDRLRRYLNVKHVPEYLTELQVKQLLQVSSRCIDNDWLLVLGLNVHDIILSKEQEYLSFILNSLKGIVVCEPEFTVGKYKIDLYLPEYRIAIECDEFNHDDRDTGHEKDRENYIKLMLNCNIVRFNPDDTGFRISNVMNHILKLIIDRTV